MARGCSEKLGSLLQSFVRTGSWSAEIQLLAGASISAGAQSTHGRRENLKPDRQRLLGFPCPRATWLPTSSAQSRATCDYSPARFWTGLFLQREIAHKRVRLLYCETFVSKKCADILKQANLDLQKYTHEHAKKNYQRRGSNPCQWSEVPLS